MNHCSRIARRGKLPRISPMVRSDGITDHCGLITYLFLLQTGHSHSWPDTTLNSRQFLHTRTLQPLKCKGHVTFRHQNIIIYKRTIPVDLSESESSIDNDCIPGIPCVPAQRAPVDDPPELRLAPAAAAGGVSGPVAAPAHLDHAPPPEGGQLRPQSAENRRLLMLTLITMSSLTIQCEKISQD